jgi:ribose-phosphate pyrophosphokinase
MPYNRRGQLTMVACNSGKPLLERMNNHLVEIIKNDDPDINYPHILARTKEITFANGEIKNVIESSIRGNDVYIIQLFDDPLIEGKSVNDNLMSLITMIDAAFHGDAENITILLPHFPYARQERRADRESISAKLVAGMIEFARANRVITVDVHAAAIAGFFHWSKFENILPNNRVASWFMNWFEQESGEKFNPNEFKVVGPDMGSAKRSKTYALAMKTDLAIIYKERPRDSRVVSEIENMILVGDVKDKHVFIGDDMIDTGGTIVNACKLLKDKGAKDIYVSCTFPFFHGKAIERLESAYNEGIIKKVIGTDCVFRGEDFSKQHPWYAEISMANLFAEIVYAINRRRSISKLLE